MNIQQSFSIKQPLLSKSKIVSVGTFLPTEVVKSDDLFQEINSDQQWGIPINWMSRFMGIVERRMCEPDAKPSDLAIPAAYRAIVNADINPNEIDLVIFCGIERDQPEPATAHKIQVSLGLNANYVFDISNACIGFIDAIQIANKFIATGAARYALVVTGEITTKVTRAMVDKMKKGTSREQALNSLGSLSVGDAGGAVVIGAADPLQNEGFQHFDNYVDSNHIDKCIYRHTDNGFEGQMKMTEILDQLIKMHRSKIKGTLKELQWSEFDWLISHQTGSKNFRAFRDLDGVKNADKMVKTYTHYGNLTTATFALSWEKLQSSGKVKLGDRVGGLFAGSGITTCQFGIYF